MAFGGHNGSWEGRGKRSVRMRHFSRASCRYSNSTCRSHLRSHKPYPLTLSISYRVSIADWSYSSYPPLLPLYRNRTSAKFAQALGGDTDRAAGIRIARCGHCASDRGKLCRNVNPPSNLPPIWLLGTHADGQRDSASQTERIGILRLALERKGGAIATNAHYMPVGESAQSSTAEDEQGVFL